MTKHELLVVSAYTGYCLCKFDDLHKFVEETLGRPVWTHEFAEEAIWKELRERLLPELLCIVKEAQL